MAKGALDAGHARALLALDRAEDQVGPGPRGRAQGPVRARGGAAGGRCCAPRGRAPRAQKDANTRAAEERLRAALGTRVQISRGASAGTLRIAFTSEAELNRLFELLLRAGRGRGYAGDRARAPAVLSFPRDEGRVPNPTERR